MAKRVPIPDRAPNKNELPTAEAAINTAAVQPAPSAEPEKEILYDYTAGAISGWEQSKDNPKFYYKWQTVIGESPDAGKRIIEVAVDGIDQTSGSNVSILKGFPARLHCFAIPEKGMVYPADDLRTKPTTVSIPDISQRPEIMNVLELLKQREVQIEKEQPPTKLYRGLLSMTSDYKWPDTQIRIKDDLFSGECKAAEIKTSSSEEIVPVMPAVGGQVKRSAAAASKH